MRITKTLYLSSRKRWRGWLSKHYKKDREIWLVYYRKGSGKPRIAYNDAVEEALCFGWIDSTVKSLGKDRFAQRFSPRKPGSKFSQANRERLKKLIKQGKVRKDVLATLGGAATKRFRAPADILQAIKANSRAWKNYQKFSPAYRRIRIAFIDGARNRPAEFKKRLRHFIRLTAMNKRFGFGGIEKYY